MKINKNLLYIYIIKLRLGNRIVHKTRKQKLGNKQHSHLSKLNEQCSLYAKFDSPVLGCESTMNHSSKRFLEEIYHKKLIGGGGVGLKLYQDSQLIKRGLCFFSLVSSYLFNWTLQGCLTINTCKGKVIKKKKSHFQLKEIQPYICLQIFEDRLK